MRRGGERASERVGVWNRGGGTGAEEGKREEKKAERRGRPMFLIHGELGLSFSPMSLSARSPNSSAVIHKSFDDAAS